MPFNGAARRRYGELTPEEAEQYVSNEALARLLREQEAGGKAPNQEQNKNKGSKDQGYVSTANKSDWDSLRKEASRWGMADMQGLPTEEYWKKIGGKPWWVEEVDTKRAMAFTVPMRGDGYIPADAQESLLERNAAGPGGFDEAVFEEALNNITGGSGSSSGGGGSTQAGGAGAGKTETEAERLRQQIATAARLEETEALSNVIFDYYQRQIEIVGYYDALEEFVELDGLVDARRKEIEKEIQGVEQEDLIAALYGPGSISWRIDGAATEEELKQIEQELSEMSGGAGAGFSQAFSDIHKEADTKRIEFFEANKAYMGESAVGELLSAVLTPEQQALYLEAEAEAWSLLTKEQKLAMMAGEKADFAFDASGREQLQSIEDIWSRFYSQLDPAQEVDILFLGSSMLDGVDWDTRQAILRHLKDHDGEITYEDLVGLGVYEPGTLAEGGLLRWLQNLDFGGGPAHYGAMLSTEFHLNQHGTNFWEMDQEERKRQQAQAAQFTSMMVGLAVGAWMENKLYGPASPPLPGGDGPFNYTGTKWEGQGGQTGVRGEQATQTQTGFGETGAGINETKWFHADGTPKWPDNYGFDGIPTKTTLQPGTRIDRYGGISGKFAAPEGTTYAARSLPPGSENSPYHVYEVVKPIDVFSGRTAPWFDQPGGGLQYQFGMSIEELRDLGYIRIITP